MAPPNTRTSLREDLVALGLEAGDTVMVHASFREVGWTVGGAVSVIRAFLDLLGPDGTLAMPCETPFVSDPAEWEDPRIRPEWFETIREHLPVFDSATTPTTMGAIAEAFRTFPGTQRSDHPLVSVCARGPAAPEILAEHSLEFGEGARTPFEQLYVQGAKTLLLGVGFNRCTSLHYAEFLAPNRRTKRTRVPVWQDGRRMWVEHADMASDGGRLFPKAGASFRATGAVREGQVGSAPSLLFSTRELVDHARAFFERALSVSAPKDPP